ncbi:hypothetical protein [Hoeflea sp.]|nr:hypothetical protein [Hoeflea sp.]MBC7281152.1 hypothetical protein [Hoeflea sp.]
MTPVSQNEFPARDRFAGDNDVCDGKALVRTETPGGCTFIRPFKALNGC